MATELWMVTEKRVILEEVHRQKMRWSLRILFPQMTITYVLNAKLQVSYLLWVSFSSREESEICAQHHLVNATQLISYI